MSLPKYEHFRFSIGQFVILSQPMPLKNDDPDNWLRGTYQVVERLYQECPGGVQLLYYCRPRGALQHDREYVRFNEIELSPLPATKEPTADLPG